MINRGSCHFYESSEKLSHCPLRASVQRAPILSLGPTLSSSGSPFWGVNLKTKQCPNYYLLILFGYEKTKILGDDEIKLISSFPRK